MTSTGVNVIVGAVLAACLVVEGPVDAATSISKPTGNKKIMESAFENAGKTPGIEIWRVENFKPVPYPKSDYGKFYTGDSYIILHTKQNKRGDLSWNIHFWLGKETTQDEAGAAAILSVQLDDQLGGEPVQYREVQEHESQLFLSNFKNGVRYASGGVSSGFTHVDRDAVEKRLFQIKGKRNIRVKQVDLTIASMNKGDCFILDAGRTIYVYVGKGSKRAERLKAISAANLIRDQDHAGRAKVIVVDEYSNENEVQEFFDALGRGSPNEVPDESAGGDDEDFEQAERKCVSLYKVSDASGKMSVEKKELLQSNLDSNDCFILDTCDANIYVWIGKKCNNREKSEAMAKAENFKSSKDYPSWTRVVRVVDGAEPSVFQQYFSTWRSAGQLHSRLIRSTGEELNSLDVKSGGELPEFMPDNGEGEFEVFRVSSPNLEAVPKDLYGKFFGGEAYIVKYHTKDSFIFYIWEGVNCPEDEKTWAEKQILRLIDKHANHAKFVYIPQGQETRHFMSIFRGKLFTFLGGHVTSFKSMKDRETYIPGNARMYRVRGISHTISRVEEQAPKAFNLESDDVFVVEDGARAWIWLGKGADDVEVDIAKAVVKEIVPKVDTKLVLEGEEPQEFFDAIGGRAVYPKSFDETLTATVESRLFHVLFNTRGKLIMEELVDFEQKDLDEDDIMLLDDSTALYVWVGSGSSDDEKANIVRLIRRYMRRLPGPVPVPVIQQGEEPECFTSQFPCWNPDLWECLTSYSETKERIAAENNEIYD